MRWLTQATRILTPDRVSIFPINLNRPRELLRKLALLGQLNWPPATFKPAVLRLSLRQLPRTLLVVSYTSLSPSHADIVLFNSFHHERAASEAWPTRKNSDWPPRDWIARWRIKTIQICRPSIAIRVLRMSNGTKMTATVISGRVVLELKEKVPVMQEMSENIWDFLFILRI